MDTIRSGAFRALLCRGETRVSVDIPRESFKSGASSASLLHHRRKPGLIPGPLRRRPARSPGIEDNPLRPAGTRIRFARADNPA